MNLAGIFEANRPKIVELFLTALNVASNTAVQLLLVKLLSTSLTKSDFARYSISVLTSSFVTLLFFGPLVAALTKYAPIAVLDGKIYSLNVAIVRIVKKGLALLFSIILLILGFIAFAFASVNDELMLFVAGLLYSVPVGLTLIIEAFYTAHRQRGKLLGFQLASSITRIISTVFILCFSKDVLLLIYLPSASLLLFLVSYLYLYHNATLKLVLSNSDSLFVRNDVQMSERLVSYAIPFALWAIPLWIHQAGDRWILQLTDRSTELAELFVLTIVFSSPVNIIGTVVQQFASPITAHKAAKLGSESGKEMARVTFFSIALFVAVAVPFSLIAFIYSRDLILLLSNDKYLSVVGIGKYLQLSAILQGLAQIVSQPLFHEENLVRIRFIKWTSAVAGIILSTIGAFFFGLEGAVFAQLLSSALFLLHVVLVQSNFAFGVSPMTKTGI